MNRLFALVLLTVSIAAKGQEVADEIYDTAKRTDPLYGSSEQILRVVKPKIKADSSMLYMQQYDRTKKDNIAIQNLGDANTPFIHLLFKPYESMGMQAGITPFMNLYLSSDSSKHYDAKMPYTEFHYAQGNGGQRGMIDFDAFHTQNFGRRFNISALYHSTSNDGFYIRQSNSTKNIQVTSYYYSKNFRYTAAATATWNKVNLMENGGIEQSVENMESLKTLRGSVRAAEVSLNNARNINRFRDHKFQHVYWLIMKDAKDTLSDAEGVIGLRHTLRATSNTNYYTDLSSDYAFYDSIYYFNSNYSADSLSFRQVSNSIELTSALRETGISFRSGIQYDHFKLYEGANSGNYYQLINHNTSLYTHIHFNLSKAFRSDAYGLYYFEGYNRNDYLLKWNNRASFGNWQVYAGLLANSRRPMYRQNNIVSNHFKWNNDFKPTRYQTLSGTISKRLRKPNIYNAYYYSIPAQAFEFQLNYTLLDNFIYYGKNNTPVQGSAGQSILQAVAKMHFDLKHFQIHQELAWQTFSVSLKEQIQLPDLLSKTSIYYQGFAFKKATFIQIGFDANITSSYKAGFYNPGIQNFRVSDKSVGAYPFVDFFINAEVKTARIFIKLEHLNQDLLSSTQFPNYMFVSPYQPSAPRRLRLGFIWKFYY